MDDQQPFVDERDRARLTPPALKAVLRIFEIWSLGEAGAAALLGIAAINLRLIRSGSQVATLDEDQLTRASALIGIHEQLGTVFADEMAARWPTLNNASPLFSGRTAVQIMVSGGVPAMIEVRRHLEAMAVGL